MSVHGFTVYDMIARGALVHGDAPAIIQGERQLSFREFQRQVDVLAGGLAALGIGKGDRICVLAVNYTRYLTMYGACARHGVIAYPTHWRLTAQEVERVVERAAPRMMVVDASTLPVVAGWPERKKSVAHWYQFGEPVGPGFMPFATLSRNAVEPPVAHVAPDDPFAVISTAAVDVIPRGAALTHANVITANLTAMACIGYSAADRYLLALPLFHITALGMAMAHMHAGGTCVLVPRFDADEAVRLIDRHRVTHISDFPPVLSSLLDAAEKAGSRLPSLKHVSGLDSPQTIQRKPEKELIKPGGENVYPAEVETVIMRMEGVSGVCVYGIPDPKWGEAIKAVVEVKTDGRYTAQQVSDFVGSKIARFKRPHVVV